jgi:hypothetical protein
MNIETIVDTEKKTKKSNKTKSSKKAQPSEESIENSQPVEVPKAIEEPEPVEDVNDTVTIIENTSEEGGEETSLISKEEYNKKLNDINVLLKELNENNFKKFDLSKDFVNDVAKQLKQANKLFSKINDDFNDRILKQSISSIKKEEKPKKQVDKSKYAVNIKRQTFDEVRKFMKLEPDTLISSAEVVQSINKYVREQKEAGNPNIKVEGNNKKFRIIGELKELFIFFEKQINSGNYKNKIPEMKDEISYSDIFRYTKFCFEPTD